ncbi:MAG: hypothetical protein D3921_06045 [Candidatus Electrothrix sp. AW1]|nr:hypothetical protein [Candidatus Electrothrix sp. AX1]MCI5182065.1 hypothetical protein [Candidatus Electrothrix gigas]
MIFPFRKKLFRSHKGRISSYVHRVRNPVSFCPAESGNWRYKGTIYKIRIDNGNEGNESARVLFVQSKDGNLNIIHAFLKSTRKTPVKEARQAMKIYNMLECLKTVIMG